MKSPSAYGVHGTIVEPATERSGDSSLSGVAGLVDDRPKNGRASQMRGASNFTERGVGSRNDLRRLDDVADAARALKRRN